MLIPGSVTTGQLRKPLSSLVFHLGETGDNSKPCEAAFLSTALSDGLQVPPVVVYVSPGSLKRMTRLYKAVNSDIRVEPLRFSESELDAAAFLSMMAVGPSDSVPLYMQTILVSWPPFLCRLPLMFCLVDPP